MIETITPAVCGSRRRQRLALAGFTVGAVCASLAVGALLGLTGSLLGAQRAILAVAAVALIAAAREAGLLRIRLPQSRRQVPERWRAVLPLPVWSFGYGAGLGSGFVTFQPFATFWVACAAAVALARPLAAAVCFSFYGLGRALMVAWPRRGNDDATAAVERLVQHRRGLARANAVALVACAALLAAPTAGAAPVSLGDGLDPSISKGVLARSELVSGVSRVLIEPPGEPAVVIPNASSPSLDGDLVAYVGGGRIRIVNWRTGGQVTQVVGAISKPALDWPLLAYRRLDADYERLIVADLNAGTERIAVRVPHEGELGRPSLRGGYVAWHQAGSWGSRVVLLDLSTWRRSTIARSKISLLAHPAVTVWRIVWIEQRSARGYVRMRRLGQTRVQTLWSLRSRRQGFWSTALENRSAVVTHWYLSTGASSLFRLDF
jgi:cytochrome c biogenesis protein CcdA